MNKQEYFILALQNKAYIKQHWREFCFIKKKEPEGYWKKDPYLYRPVAVDKGYSYVDSSGELIPIQGTLNTGPMLRYLEAISLAAGTFENQPDVVDTTYGNTLVNSHLIVANFGSAIPFHTGPLGKPLEQYILDRTVDDDATLADGEVHTKQYLGFCQAVASLEPLTPYVTNAATPRNILPPAGLEKEKKRLLKKYAGQLNDPVKAVEFEDELRAFDEQWLKDDPSNGRLISGKTKNTARVKLHMVQGSSPNFTKEAQETFVVKSLKDGIETDREGHALAMSSIRYASYSRGKSTQISGTTAKEVMRILSHVSLVPGSDCGTKRTLTRTIDPGTENAYAGLSFMQGSKPVLITRRNAKEFTGKTLNFRSPMYCEMAEEHVCEVCGGQKLKRVAHGLQLGAAEISTVLMSYMFSLAKSITYKAVSVDIRRSIS